MTDLTHEDQARPTAPNLGVRLTGWKEIAAHLDRGVRTAQRWEREFGMPVRRMGIGSPGTAGRSESVFAYAAEIDAWLASASAARAQGQPERPADPAAEPPPAPATADPPAAGRQHRLLYALAGAVIVLTLLGLWRELGRRPDAAAAAAGPPATWMIEADALVVLDSAGRRLWSHRFGVPLLSAADRSVDPSVVGGIADIDGDGGREVWFISYVADSSTPMALTLFEGDGTVRWRYTPAETVRIGRTERSGPWVVHAAFVTVSPEDAARRAMWVIGRDASEFPSFLTRLDLRTGRPVGGRFWNPGWLSSVGVTRSAAGPRLVVGGSNNEHRSPAVMMLDARDFDGAPPSLDEKYRCTSCKPASILAFTLLPRPQRFVQEPGSGTAIISRVGAESDPIVVSAYYAIARGSTIASAVFHLDQALRPLQADYSDTYETAYLQMVDAGRIPASGPLASDPARELLPVLTWRDGRFVPAGIENSPISASSSSGRSPAPARPRPTPASAGPRARTPQGPRP